MLLKTVMLTMLMTGCAVDAREDWLGPKPRSSATETLWVCADGFIRGGTLWLSDFVTLEIVTKGSQEAILESRAKNIEALRIGETFGLAALGLLVFQAWRRQRKPGEG